MEAPRWGNDRAKSWVIIAKVMFLRCECRLMSNFRAIDRETDFFFHLRLTTGFRNSIWLGLLLR
jgi:hypothetical protein